MKIALLQINPTVGDLTGNADLIADALALVASDSHDSGRLLAQHGWFVGIIEADYDGAQRAFGEARRIAARDRG